MSDIRFYHSNAIGGAALPLKNGTGGGAPPLDEDADFPMSNLTNQDRYSVWKNDGTPPDPFNVDFGSSTSAGTVRLVGIVNADPAWEGALVDVYWSASNYPPSWTLAGALSFPVGSNNAFLEVSLAALKSIRFECTSVPAAAHVGNFVAYTGILDIGNEGAAGTEEDILKQRDRARTIGGVPVVNRLGANRRIFSPRWPTANATVRAGMDTLIGLDDPFILKWHDGKFHQVLFADDQLRKPRIFAASELNDLAPVFEEMP